ncbi:hypothetical protein DFH29DRAFT_880693 [Suillus ampliporus]|nr:hypothetical protein DFH29DRAFT_880693 [Suillus ampliporus]
MGPPISIGNNNTPGPSVIVEDIFTFGPWFAGPYHTGYYARPFTRIIWRWVTAIFQMPIDIARYSKLISPKDTGHNEEREKLLERCPPGHEGTKLVDIPATILDVSGAIIAWYLPDTLTDATQKEIWVASNLLAPMLEQSVKVDGNWRTNQRWFKPSSENDVLTPGCINVSLAWFQQGHEVSASLKGASSKKILKAIARPAAIATAALRVMHPE